MPFTRREILGINSPALLLHLLLPSQTLMRRYRSISHFEHGTTKLNLGTTFP